MLDLSRIGIILSLFAIGLALWFQGYYVCAIVSFVISAGCVVEMVFIKRIYRFRGIQMGKGSEAKDISNDLCDSSVLSVPISLRPPYYEVKDFRGRVVSGELYGDGEVHNAHGQTLGGSIGEVFTMNRARRKGFVSVAYLSGGDVMIGTPFSGAKLETPKKEGTYYRIKVEILEEDKAIASKCYTLVYKGQELSLSDNDV